MTVTFDIFMKQFKATGSEKADGYSWDAFVGLDENEKETVFDLLATELPFFAEWLFFLNAEKALVVAKDDERKYRGDEYFPVYLIQEQIIKYSNDLLYQNHIIE